ncbi:MAG: glycosyltransferase family 39 protein [Thermoanaerobaculales bacterium]|nr:glycosyltransferase family 39 protein [Thermoanaerobaculales bacterium]
MLSKTGFWIISVMDPRPNNQERFSWQGPTLLLSLIYLSITISMMLVVPPGEAPDEPAHIQYVDHVLEHRRLPPAYGGADETTYEAHQPPLFYLATAAFLRVTGTGAVCYPFVSNPDFEFTGDGRRAFVDQTRGGKVERAARRVMLARLPSIFLGLFSVWAVVFLVERVRRDVGIGVAAAVCFTLFPQFLFSSATVTNDVGLSAMSAIATMSLVCSIIEGPKRTFWAIMASLSTGLALWMKASGLCLFPGLLIVLILSVRRHQWSAALWFLAPAGGLGIGWFLLNFARFGRWTPALPTGWNGEYSEGLQRLLSEPWWLVSTWGSFWAKFGWFNLPMPKLMYLVFLLPTAMVAVGIVAMASRPSFRCGVLPVLSSILGTNLLLYLVFLVTADWQPQGRFLFPSIAALAAFAAVGFDEAGRWIPRRFNRVAVLAVFCLFFSTCVFTVWFIRSNYVP